ncbi:hypothetical protein CEXT_631461 [Caerostris extrusa]|uniref:Uncharacterized protein n=1 Tax=Caerostris extrusa TaxID=172846 RepID=A0AAV4Y1I1_CAEEX|nr:hypothetical protein CEXT_631461 [Caerostris extrusa]
MQSYSLFLCSPTVKLFQLKLYSTDTERERERESSETPFRLAGKELGRPTFLFFLSAPLFKEEVKRSSLKEYSTEPPFMAKVKSFVTGEGRNSRKICISRL